ncbi:unnamed protein product [Ilex paraguariensis]|uniref:Acid phosphatase n=1 Tax=Ilex paraguariensis TaxID=185542 RepID=A0ABC8S448_9AQUA
MARPSIFWAIAFNDTKFDEWLAEAIAPAIPACRKDFEKGTTALVYKSNKRKELEEAGYRIWGNMGDQWSDLLGTNVGNRTFKVPNPMFYIG